MRFIIAYTNAKECNVNKTAWKKRALQQYCLNKWMETYEVKIHSDLHDRDIFSNI